MHWGFLRVVFLTGKNLLYCGFLGVGMVWRFMDLQDDDPYQHHAYDEAIMAGVASGKSPPTVRLWRVGAPTVSICRAQSLEDLDIDACNKQNVSIVRRRSGGRSEYLSSGDICYSLFFTRETLGHDPIDLTKNNELMAAMITRALKAIGIDAELRNKSDILVANKKIGNIAQHRKADAVLIQGKIRYERDLRSALPLLHCYSCNGGAHTLDDHFMDMDAVTTSVSELADITEGEFVQALKTALLENKTWSKGDYLPHEQMLAQELARMHADIAWIKQADGRRLSRKGNCDEYWGETSNIKTKTL